MLATFHIKVSKRQRRANYVDFLKEVNLPTYQVRSKNITYAQFASLHFACALHLLHFRYTRKKGHIQTAAVEEGNLKTSQARSAVSRFVAASRMTNENISSTTNVFLGQSIFDSEVFKRRMILLLQF